MNLRFRFALATLSAFSLVSAGCSADGGALLDSEGASDVAESSDENASALTNGRPTWFRIVESGGRLFAQSANRTSTACADGTSDVRCRIARVDFSALGLDAATLRHVEAQLSEDTILVYATPKAARMGGNKFGLRLVATRAFENQLRVFPEGDLYEVKKLPASLSCTLARLVAPPFGVFAPARLETFAGACTHNAATLNSVAKFDVDEPDWSSREQFLPLGTTEDVVADLEAGASIVSNGHWMSNASAAFSHPSPVQIWRDVKRITP